ncbi:hypothetical protein GCM10012289_52180 [Nonomuraea cavernae]|uniref:Uncharacterized protein n=1 Tax=Nonomuraea cavernae TaxID=2045107 RepID=A0A917Z780_9ACTN|nr:hypothetical protein GCM10012289_52180 [Nonomuraea cavernae]
MRTSYAVISISDAEASVRIIGLYHRAPSIPLGQEDHIIGHREEVAAQEAVRDFRPVQKKRLTSNGSLLCVQATNNRRLTVNLRPVRVERQCLIRESLSIGLADEVRSYNGNPRTDVVRVPIRDRPIVQGRLKLI